MGGHRPGRWGLTSRAVAAGCLLVVLIGLAFAVLIASITGLQQRTAAVHQARAATVQARVVEGLIIDAETGQRGYLITGQNQILQPWKNAVTQFPSQARKLVQVSVSPSQRHLAQQISQAGGAYFRDYSIPLVNAARSGDPGAHSTASTDEGKRRVDALRVQFNRYDAAGVTQITALQHAADARASEAIAAASVGLAGSAALIIAASGYVLVGIVRPVRRAAAGTALVAGGDLTPRLPESGAGEIGDLARGFNAMAASLQTARQRLSLLYDARTALGGTLDAGQAARNLAGVAVPRFADFTTVDLAVPAAPGTSGPVTWRRIALAGISGDTPLDHVGTLMAPAASRPSGSTGGDVTFVADLAASAEWRSRYPGEASRLLAHGMRSQIFAPMYAYGAAIGAVTFWRCRDTAPFSDDDLADAGEIAAMAALALDNATRYDRERATAVALQHSLLPQQIPGHPAVETATSYLPANTGAEVGGDWFDVIPLSSARVALVVGDIVGHGIRAAATMGQIRTAVRTLADVDLPPDELLTQLNDVVIHLTGGDQPATADAGPTPTELTATCLYAIYDPVSCQCTLASAGHLPPIAVTPAGTADLLPVEPGPPLGISGVPFETTRLDIAPGSVLTLFTDGLLQTTDHDLGHGVAKLRGALTQPMPSLQAACETVVATMLATHPADDATLLLARTRALPPSHTVTWDIPADPEQVATARTLVTSQLEAWDMAAASFTTELVASELVTNAIRYGSPPIQLRLIRDTTLICEVSDASTTAPHMRRAGSFDEGGRGLMLVAQLTQRWGARYHADGKTIWCEQTLSEDPGSAAIPLEAI